MKCDECLKLHGYCIAGSYGVVDSGLCIVDGNWYLSWILYSGWCCTVFHESEERWNASGVCLFVCFFVSSCYLRRAIAGFCTQLIANGLCKLHVRQLLCYS